MDVFRDLLDKQLLDMKGRKIGKVDGLVMTVTTRGRPRIAFIELGSVTLARRLGPRLARWTARIAAVLGDRRGYVPFRISWEKVTDVAVDIEVAVELEATPLNSWRERLRKHVLDRMPGT